MTDAAKEEGAGRSRAGRGELVFVADDSSTVRAYVEFILAEEGFEARAFPEGASLLAALGAGTEGGARPCDIVLLDSEMPLMDGFATLAAIRADESLAGLPVIFLSAMTDKDRVVSTLRAGAADYIAKPFRPDELFARLRVHLDLERARRELEARRDEAARARDELAAANAMLLKTFDILAHDLRGPVGSFAQALDFLAEAEGLGGEDRELLGRLRDSASGVQGLLENLLSWSRGRRGSLRIETASRELGELAREALRPLEMGAANKELALDLEIPAGLRAFCDAFSVTTVLRNLVSNAIKFSPRGARIRVAATAAAEGASVRLEVADQGAGMTREQLERIMERGELLSTWGTEREKGSGIGLDLCRSLLASGGSRLEVESEPGRGSRFYFSLPAG